MTLQQACRQAAKAFAAAGIPDPAWDSGLLMERATGIPPLMARLSQRELTEAVAYLGYRDLSEWLQRMRGDTVRKYRARLEKAALVAAGETSGHECAKGRDDA